MLLTRENAAEYEGKMLDCSRMLDHTRYYPLKVIRDKKTGFRVVDRFKLQERIPEEGIEFDTVKEV
jgi:hypothetical protein